MESSVHEQNLLRASDIAMSGSDEVAKQAQDFLAQLYDNKDYSSSDLFQIIQSCKHENSLFFACDALVRRTCLRRAEMEQGFCRQLWRILIERAVSVSENFSYPIQQKFIKSSATILILNFFDDAVLKDEGGTVTTCKEGPLFQLLRESRTPQDYLIVAELLDEMFCQVLNGWKLFSRVSYDFTLLIQKNLLDYSLGFFIKLALEIGESFLGLQIYDRKSYEYKFFEHLGDFLENALKFSINESKPDSLVDDDQYHPSSNVKELFLNFTLPQFAFKFEKFSRDYEVISLQSLRILTRLSYATGETVFIGNSKTRYRNLFMKDLITLLNGPEKLEVTPDNAASVIYLLCCYTCIQYAEEKFDSKISDFPKTVGPVLGRMVPLVVEKIYEIHDSDTNKIARDFCAPAKFLAFCLQDDEETKEAFLPVVIALFNTLWNDAKLLDQSKESRDNYKALMKTATDAGIFFMEDFYQNIVITGFKLEDRSLKSLQNVMALPWCFYEIGEIMRRSYSEDVKKFGNFDDHFYRSYKQQSNFDIEHGEDVEEYRMVEIQSERDNHVNQAMEAYHTALLGILPHFDEFDYVTRSMIIMLWWLKKLENELENEDFAFRIHNANLLSSTFWALSQGIQATHKRVGDVGYLKPKNNDFGSRLVLSLLNTVFHYIDKYRDYPNVIDEAVAVLDNMVWCDYFQFQINHLLQFLPDMLPVPRKVFAIFAKAFSKVAFNNKDAVDKFVVTVLKPYSNRIHMLSRQIDPLAMIEIIDIHTGFADALLEYPDKPIYGDEIKRLFQRLCVTFSGEEKSLYDAYKDFPQVVTKMLEFVTVAIPSIISYNISSENFDSTAEMIFTFVHMYCINNVEKWNKIDHGLTNEGFDDLILLMEIAKDALDRLIISYSDEDLLKIAEKMGSFSLDIFVPLITPFRASVLVVLKTFSNMLQAVTRYDAMSVIERVKSLDDPLLVLLQQILQSSNTPELISQSIEILDYILQKREFVFQIKAWRIFFRYAFNPIFHIVITSVKDDTLYKSSKNCLYYMVAADRRFFEYFLHHILEKQPPLFKSYFFAVMWGQKNEDPKPSSEDFCNNFFQHLNELRRQGSGSFTYVQDQLDMDEILNGFYVLAEHPLP